MLKSCNNLWIWKKFWLFGWFDGQMRGAEVERALQMTVSEVERKFQRRCEEGSHDVKDGSTI